MPLSQRKGPQALEWWTWVGMGVNVVMMAVIFKTGRASLVLGLHVLSRGGHLTGC